MSLGNVVNRVSQIGNGAATIVNAVSQASSAISAIFGGGSGIVTLGDIDFDGFEVPEKITVGGQMQMTVHKLTGGERVIDVMGRDDRALEWSGILQGPGAVQRAQQLDLMRVAGDEQALLWAAYDYTVVISSFECDYGQGGFWLPYRISCTVLRDEAQLDDDSDDEADEASIDGGLAGAISDVQDVLSDVQGAISTAAAVGQQVVGAAAQVAGVLGIPIPFLASASAGLAQAQGFAYSLGQVSSGLAQVQGLSDSLGSVGATLAAGRDACCDAVSSLSAATFSGVNELVSNAGAAARMASAADQVSRAQAAVPLDAIKPVPASGTGVLTIPTTSDSGGGVSVSIPLAPAVASFLGSRGYTVGPFSISKGTGL